ncbi:Zn-ribbon domain-containing OB-fold protein [Sulfitobacter dubius]|uniref:Zn-ribbon domain-containing OB-fold protein n=1 Tax=Sulfitobacter dubius TaxID=218673 RepID=UPI0022AECE01|nr:zinc ribbon domain-containing protein [Sulfitobacter dubius]MCZ4366310.1 zinc ribbon domain-containing protein [Sulfitobacter dubius]
MTEEALALFQSEGTDQLPDNPALIGGGCDDCGYVFFPMQRYGCEKCGSTALRVKKLTGRGTLIASAFVHMPVGTPHEGPFWVGSIQTDDGAILRSILQVSEGAVLKPGTPMITKLVPETRPNHGAQDLRFMPAAD